jgi:hypothetical protein
MQLCGDWLFWIRLCTRGKIAYVAAPLNYRRLNTSNARTLSPGDLEWIEGEQILNEAADFLELEPFRVRRLSMLSGFGALLGRLPPPVENENS